MFGASIRRVKLGVFLTQGECEQIMRLGLNVKRRLLKQQTVDSRYPTELIA